MRDDPTETQSGSSPVWMLREFDCARRQAAEALFSQLQLQDPAQHFLLFMLEHAAERGETPSQGDIALRMHRAPATVTASLKALEKHGFIRRTPDENDLRINRVELTEAGRDMAVQCHCSMYRLESAMFDGFSEEELCHLSEYFMRMSRNLIAVRTAEKEDRIP